MTPHSSPDFKRRDKRRESRRLVTGGVRVKFVDPETFEVDGRLIDLSASGFRMSHECHSLRSGQVVEFEHVEARGRAQVMWTRIFSGRVETGFLITHLQS